MKNDSCMSYPECPPCFGLCDTEYAPYDMGDNKACDGCKKCRAEKAKERKIIDTRVDTVISTLYEDGKIKEEALSILYIENIISRNTFYRLKGENCGEPSKNK